jgi:hypothetical protein
MGRVSAAPALLKYECEAAPESSRTCPLTWFVRLALTTSTYPATGSTSGPGKVVGLGSAVVVEDAHRLHRGVRSKLSNQGANRRSMAQFVAESAYCGDLPRQSTRCRAGTPEPLLLGQMDLTYPCLELTRDRLDIDESLSGVEHQAHELARLGLQDVAVEGVEDVRR